MAESFYSVGGGTFKKYCLSFAMIPVMLASFLLPLEAEARKHSSSSAVKSSHSSKKSSSTKSAKSRGSRNVVAQKSSSRRGKSRVVASSRQSRSRRGHVAHSATRSRHHVVAHAAPKPRYAYPIGIFMRNAPAFDTSPLDVQNANHIASAFENGSANTYAARVLVRAGIVKYHPLHGGIFWRREPVKYIIMHSTETGIPIGAARVIDSWSSMGMRHPGAQYVVERDGTIYQAVDPDLATVHINIFKTLPGINNDNSIGIEMCHTGAQNYPQAQLHAVTRLVGYLQSRYNVGDDNIITHRYAQQGDHTDPVNFDWYGFLATKNSFRNQAIAYRSRKIKDDSKHWKREVEVPVNTYMKPHTQLSKPTGLAPGQSPAVVPGSVPEAVPAAVPSVIPGIAPRPGTDVIEVPVPEPSQADPTSVIDRKPVAPPAKTDRPPAGALGAPGSAPLPGEDI